jgi:GDP-L-fucose synthase
MMNKDSKIYVAGHRGLVGSAVVKRLKEDGYSNLILRTREELNLLSQDDVKDFFQKEKPEYVIDAAAKVGGIKANMTYPAEFLYENLQMQNNIIWSAFEAGVEKLLFLGSSCIYPRESPQPITEEYFFSGKVEPTNEGYAIAKIAGMKLCEKIHTEYNRKFISCMPTNIYGWGDNFEIDSSHVIPALMNRMYDAKVKNISEVSIWGSGTNRREFLFVDDLADAIIWIMNNYEGVEFLNVGTGIDVSIKELATLIKEVVGFEGNLVFDTTKPDGMPMRRLDVSKLSNYGWHANTELKDGLEKTFKWFIENIV